MSGMTVAEAMTRPDTWQPFQWGDSWRVGRRVGNATVWHMNQPRYPGSRRSSPITFRSRTNAELRAWRLNVDDAKESKQ